MSGWFETVESDGTLRTVWDEAAGVELLDPLEVPDEVWAHQMVSSPFVDGQFSVGSSLEGMRMVMRVKVRAASTAAVEGIFQALKADVTVTHSLMLRTHINGVGMTWRAYRPDVSAPVTNAGLLTNTRVVTFTWPVLPHPTITGTV